MKRNNDQFQWTVKNMSSDRIAKAGVSTAAADERQIADAKRDYQELTLHERINRRGGK